MILGHYIPELALLLIEYNKQQRSKPIKLKAIAVNNSPKLSSILISLSNCLQLIILCAQNFFSSYVLQLGNPLLDSQISIDADEFLWSHGVISDELLALKKTVCNDATYFLELMHNNLTKECKDIFRDMMEEVGNETDPGDLLIPICLSPTSTTQTAFLGNLADAKVNEIC